MSDDRGHVYRTIQYGVDPARLYLFLRSRPLVRNDPRGLGCSICLKNPVLEETIYETDDPDDVVACIYSYEFDVDHPRHGQSTTASMTVEQRV